MHILSHRTTAALILAAGRSSRMEGGRHKLLLPLGERAVLAHVVAAALASQAEPIIVVLGYQAESARESLALYVKHQKLSFIENPAYLEGMSTSIRAGLQALIVGEYAVSSPLLPDSVLILLGDQPLMTAHIIDTLIATRQATDKPIIVPLYHGKRGNPVLFAASLFPELMMITGDEGGRSVIERHRQEMITVELGDEVACYDVDTWEAYQQVLAAWRRNQKSEGR
jgi:molybdenum cofactor cytidylyltransferase